MLAFACACEVVKAYESTQLAKAMLYEVLGARGRCKLFELFASGCLGAWLDFGSCGTVFVPPGWILCGPGLHFESFVSLWGEP